MKAAIFVILICTVLSQTPIPSRSEGFNFGDKKSGHKLDVYYDLLCVDSASFDPQLKSFFNMTYTNGMSWYSLLDITIHLFPLPYHRNAFLVTQLYPYIRQNLDSISGWQYINWGLQNQNLYLGQAVNMTQDQVIQSICQSASQSVTLLRQQDCLDLFYKDLRNYWWNQARTSWKFAAYNSITGTPTLLLNGVQILPMPTNAEGLNTYFTSFLNQNGMELVYI